MTSKIGELNDAEIEVVAGGANCAPARTTAGVYLAAATVFGALGDSVNQAYFAGLAGGILQGGCPR